MPGLGDGVNRVLPGLLTVDEIAVFDLKDFVIHV